ncbi:MAG: ACT domain-containing protein [Clostridium sp.]|uniref:ACT domain-containing protein n=1 Tax=Clostridium sp. TaxID=1506 RepID=UPI0025BBA271|nr:ACT domain-containing protein [Clostridium sp.]MCH3963064.1 ACT domain-containing protein [Clostridium sp.]MCI1716473.1 ACT domain-containing protein [Clostridium sp.]MCI1800813.1 ACT domain-containing protein [Clostridium sp.]MCI1814532.1 ACT domain-containing protein [Clostridium sp.]MCI1871442.1 ACT domain-containing protein [Clostridium sp.]
MKAFITVLGKDKVGIIHEITSILSENSINILDINQTLIKGYFTMIMLVDISNMKVNFNSLKDILTQKADEIKVSIKIQREDIFTSMHEI